MRSKHYFASTIFQLTRSSAVWAKTVCLPKTHPMPQPPLTQRARLLLIISSELGTTLMVYQPSSPIAQTTMALTTFHEKLIPLVILNALEGKPLPVYGDGSQIRDWLFVEDHASALLTAVQQMANRDRPTILAATTK